MCTLYVTMSQRHLDLPDNMPVLPPVYPAYRLTVRSVTEVADTQERTLLEQHRLDFPRLLHRQAEQPYPEVKFPARISAMSLTSHPVFHMRSERRVSRKERLHAHDPLPGQGHALLLQSQASADTGPV